MGIRGVATCLIVLSACVGALVPLARAGDDATLTPAFIERINELTAFDDPLANKPAKQAVSTPVANGPAWHDLSGMDSKVLSTKGYDPLGVALDGALSCYESGEPAGGASMINLMKNVSQLGTYNKAQLLIYFALGFARTYNEHRTEALESGQKNRNADGVDRIVRSLSGLASLQRKGGQQIDWCAAFLSVITRLVDEELKGAHSQIWDNTGKSEGLDYAGAEKLLAVFDPRTPLYPDLFSGKPPKKVDSSFLGPDQKPIPGCIAVFTDAKPGSKNGHVGLVVSVSSDHKMQTIEGNTQPVEGSKERGIFAEASRPWGDKTTVESKVHGPHGKSKIEILTYRGCVLPWPDMQSIGDSAACPGAVNESTFKPLDVSPGGACGSVDRSKSSELQ